MAELKLFVLGPPRIELDGAQVDIQRRKAVAILVYLAVSGQAHSREALATLFWPDLDPQRGRAYLRRDLAELNTRLRGNWLIADRETIELNRQPGLWLDTEQFQRLRVAYQAHGHPSDIVCAECILLLTEAVALYTGDFLAGFTLRDSPEFDDWQFFQMESLRQGLATALERLVQGLIAQDKADAAISHARRRVALDPLHEPAQRQLIQLYDLTGQPAAALRHYDEYVKLLEAELGLPPEEETSTLYEAIRAKRIFAPFIKAEEYKRSSRAGRADKPAPPPQPSPSEPALASPTGSPPLAPVASALFTDDEPKAVEPINFVARERELSQLNVWLEAALAGQLQVVFITGEAGLGKSALLQVFASRAQTVHPALVAVGGNCNAYTGIGDPYLPFREIMGLLTGDVEARTVGTLRREQARRLSHLLPRTVQALLEVGPDLLDIFVPAKALLNRAATQAQGDAPWLAELRALIDRPRGGRQQSGLFEQYARVLRRLSQENPLLLFLDDLQWADSGSTHLLFHLARRLTGCRVLMVGAYRPDEVVPGHDNERHPLEKVLNELQRDFGDIVLDLSQAEGRAFVDAWLDSQSNQLGDSFRQMLYRQTGGHPLFTVELLRAMQERGELVQNEEGNWVVQSRLNWQTLPARVEGAIGERISRLPAPLRELLQVASIEGEEFTAEVVAKALDLPDRIVVRQLSHELDKTYRLVQALGIKQVGAKRLSRYRFHHILIQHYLYNSLDEIEKCHLSEIVGNALEALYADQTEQVAVQLARHFEQAGLIAKAVDYLGQAGERAVRLSANEEAIAHFTKALTLLETFPDTPERAQQELELQIALGPALIAARGYAVPEVKQAYSRARELVQHGKESPQLFRALFGLWVYYLVRAELPTARALGEQVLTLAQHLQEPALLLEAHQALGMTLFHLGEFALARAHLEQGREIYDPKLHSGLAFLSVADPGVTCSAYLARTLWQLGYPEQALRVSHEALNLAQKLAHPYSLAAAHVYIARVYQCRQEARVTQEQAEAAITLSIEQGFPHYSAMGKVLAGWAVARQGNGDQGITLIRDGLTTGRNIQTQVARTHFLAMLAEALGQVGQIEEGLNVLAEALAGIDNSEERQWEAELYRLKGDLLLKKQIVTAQPDETLSPEDYFLKAIEIARRQQAKLLELRATISLGRLWRELGREAEARQMLEEIYGWFSEGFETIDLQEARTLLEELGSEVKSSSKGAGEQGSKDGEKTALLPVPRRDLKQQIYYCYSPDGVRLAYATVGQGPPLVKAANWLSHLGYDWHSPVWRHWLEGLTRRHTLIRYDERGCGLSDWEVNDLSFEAWVRDLETVVEATGLERFPLLGLSQGVAIAIAYAVRHPEKVSHLILYGGYARGRLNRDLTPQQLEEAQTFIQLIKLGWGQENPAFRQVFTTLFMPDATLEQQRWFNDLQRMSASPGNAMRIVTGFNTIDIRSLVAQVKAPTLVLHAKGDARIPFSEGELLTSLIPGARLVPLESNNHILLEHEPAWRQFLDEVHQFLGVEPVERPNHTTMSLAPALSPELAAPIAPRHVASQGTPFVGRKQEYAQLVEMVKGVTSSAGRVILIEGEPGIGKSRLVEEVVRHAQNQGVVVLSSKCYEAEQHMPYQTVIDLVYQALAGCPSETFQHLPAHTLAELALLVPEIDQSFPNLPVLPAGLDQARQARLFRSLQQFLTAPAGEQGLMLVIDDLHWTDEVTLQFLHYLARHIATQPVLLIGTFRSEEAAANEQLSAYLHTILQEPQSSHMVLNRLSLEDVSAWVASLPAPAPQAAELGQWLYRETEGNPFFLSSILQSLQEQGVLKEDGTTWQINLHPLQAATSELTLPEALREAIRNRLHRVSKQARTILEVAAVYSGRFDLPVLSAVTAESELSLLDVVEDLTARQLLREDGEGRYDFFHDKIREVVYLDLSMMRRRLLHRRVAEVLEGWGNHPPGALAEHFEKGQVWDQAISYLAQAAEQARKLFAMPEALRFYDRAIALAEQYSDTVNPMVRLELYEQRGKARGLIGGMADEAIADLDLVLEAARAAGEQDKERDLLINMGQVYRRVDQYNSALHYLEAGLQRARQRGDQQSVVDALYHLGTVAWSQGYNDQALVYHQEAADICRQLGLANLVAVQAFHGLGEARWLSGDARGGIELYEESLNLARQIGDKGYECENLGNIGYASQGLHGIGDYQRAEQILKEGLEISRAAHLEWHFVIALAHLGLNAASTGDFQQAITFINQSIELTEAIGAKRLQSTYTWARGFIWQELNLLERAKADHAEAIALAQQTHAGDWLPRLEADFAISQLRLGNLGVGHALHVALARALNHRMEIHATRCLEGLAELAIAKREPDQALAYSEQLWALAEQYDLREIMARALRWRGVALLTLGPFEPAAAALEQALEMAEIYGRIRLIWQIHEALADLYRVQKQEEQASNHDRQVQKIVHQIAANLQEAEFRAGLPLRGFNRSSRRVSG
jgi:predicted ATPase/DNA-binding SARP family transcriptional activator/pimeloyl-ACP methyl ester carboxylesterase